MVETFLVNPLNLSKKQSDQALELLTILFIGRGNRYPHTCSFCIFEFYTLVCVHSLLEEGTLFNVCGFKYFTFFGKET